MAAMGRRRALGVLLGGGLAWALPRASAAAPPPSGRVSVVARLSSPSVEVGEAVELMIEVTSYDGEDTPDPTLPDLTAMGFAVEGPRTTFNQRSSWINGRVSSTVSKGWVYYLIPSKPGRFELPVQVMWGGKAVRAPAVPVVEVTGAPTPAAPVIAEAGSRPTEAQGDVFVWASVDKARAFVGEPIAYELEIYERVRFQNIHLRELPGFLDFWSEALPEGKQRAEVVAGVAYRVHPGMRRALFPQRAGSLTISAAQVGVGARRRVSGQALQIEVLPLPAAGQPPGFSPNNVGTFTIAAKVDRAAVKVGEPFTLTVTIRGDGNIRTIDPGAWPELPGMRRYDPKVETKVVVGERFGGERRYDFLVIPEVGGALTIPAFTFAYFDPAKERYEVASTPTLAIEVEGPPATVNAGGARELSEEAGASDAAQGAEDELLAPIFAGEGLTRAAAREPWLTYERWQVGMAAAPALGIAGWAAAGLHRRYGADAAGRARAAKLARQRELVSQAERAVSSGDGFHGALAQALQTLALERAGAAGEGLPRRGLLELLRRRGCDPVEVTMLGDLLDRCDAARFGANAGENASARREVLAQAMKLLRSSSLARGGGGG
jgi:hypothetical protein